VVREPWVGICQARKGRLDLGNEAPALALLAQRRNDGAGHYLPERTPVLVVARLRNGWRDLAEPLEIRLCHAAVPTDDQVRLQRQDFLEVHPAVK
jgi:hypothetical protein